MKQTMILIAVLLLAFVAPVANAAAPSARRIVATITEVAHGQLAVRPADGAPSRVFALNAKTPIYRGLSEVPTSALDRGQQVQVSYRAPFFGPAYATNVVILSAAQTRTHK